MKILRSNRQTGNGAKRNSGEQRNRSVTESQEFLSGSPERSLPVLVQFEHSSVPGTRKQSFSQGRQYPWLNDSCAASDIVLPRILSRYYDALITFLDYATQEQFLKPPHCSLLVVEPGPDAVLDRFTNYTPKKFAIGLTTGRPDLVFPNLRDFAYTIFCLGSVTIFRLVGVKFT